jgi:MFS family permease
MTGLFIVSSTAWLLDSSPSIYRGTVVALFNLVAGVSAFAAAMISGYVLDFLVLTIPYETAVILMMLSIVVIRVFASMGYLTVNETLVKTPAPTVTRIPGPDRAP